MHQARFRLPRGCGLASIHRSGWLSQSRPLQWATVALLCGGLVALSGCGVTVKTSYLTASPGSINFGNVAVGSSASAVVAVSNTGNTAIQVAGVQLTGSAFNVGSQSNIPTTIAAGASYNLYVNFNPTAAGAATGQLTIASDAINGSQLAIDLTGTGTGTAPAAAELNLSATSIPFGTVSLNTPATQMVTLTSSGTAALTINSVAVQGTGFTISGVTTPLTLNPGQTAMLAVQFDPTTAGAATGTVSIASNATNGATMTIALTGTGGTAGTSYAVDLTWDAPVNSTDPVSGYDIYRATGSSSTFVLLNSSVNAPTTYADSTVQSGSTYSYYVTSVDAAGVESVPSNTYTVTIP